MNTGMGKAHLCIFSQSDDPNKGCTALNEKYCMTDGKCSFYKSSAEWWIVEGDDGKKRGPRKINREAMRKDSDIRAWII